MWIVTKIGFFNIVCQDDDEKRERLTIKARSKDDLINVRGYIPFDGEIEESQVTDYRFRVKVLKRSALSLVEQLADEIDYPKTKPALAKKFPERSDIYLRVWDNLYHLQTRDAKKA